MKKLASDWRRQVAVQITIVSLAAGVLASCDVSKASSSLQSPASSASHATAGATPSSASGTSIGLKATASITFRSNGFLRSYTLDSDSNPANGLNPDSGQAFLDLGSSSGQELHVTVVGDGAPGATLKGPNEILAAFTDEVARVGGIATVGQGTCTLTLTSFGVGGLAGHLDCEDIAPLMSAGAPVAFTASLEAVPA